MNKLIFVTSKYPYSSGETFIENEIKYLSMAFDKIYIFCVDANEEENKREVPQNVVIFPANRKEISRKDYLPPLIKPNVIKEIFSNCIGNKMISKISAACYFDACVSESLKRSDEFSDICDIKPEDKITVYSYWLSTIGMCAIRISDTLKSKGINVKNIARCHGYDIRFESRENGYLEFQKYMIDSFNSIFPCSLFGEKYLKCHYPDFSKKINYNYLGIADKFLNKFPTKNSVFNIVTCSNVDSVKRVISVAKALSEIKDKQICWTHFGDGVLFNELKTTAKNILPSNIQYDFRGRIPNNQIYDYYNNNNVNLFINVSLREGLPVSIMEAVSFGIPVIATGVGGTGEIAEDGKNGFLLKENFDINDLTDLIIKFIEMTDEEYKYYCKNARKTYEEKFNAEKNYSDFCRIIKGEAL